MCPPPSTAACTPVIHELEPGCILTVQALARVPPRRSRICKILCKILPYLLVDRSSRMYKSNKLEKRWADMSLVNADLSRMLVDPAAYAQWWDLHAALAA